VASAPTEVVASIAIAAIPSEANLIGAPFSARRARGAISCLWCRRVPDWHRGEPVCTTSSAAGPRSAWARRHKAKFVGFTYDGRIAHP
jgi:hypothetical protein